jgi:hypothetical protein
VTVRRGLDWMVGFINLLYTQLRTTSNYSVTADLHTLQFTVIHTLGFSVFTSRILATDLNTVSLSLQHTRSLICTATDWLTVSRNVTLTWAKFRTNQNQNRRTEQSWAELTVSAEMCSRHPETGCVTPFIKYPLPQQERRFMTVTQQRLCTLRC